MRQKIIYSQKKKKLYNIWQKKGAGHESDSMKRWRLSGICTIHCNVKFCRYSFAFSTTVNGGIYFCHDC